MVPVFKLSADAPISTGTADLLGRTAFAASCAAAIVNWQDDASLVIAIWGDWGSGKSSLKNLIVENLSGLDEDRRPAMVEFNPWQVPMGSITEPVLRLAGFLTYRIDEPDQVDDVVAAGCDMAYEDDLAVAILLGQRLIGRKVWTK